LIFFTRVVSTAPGVRSTQALETRCEASAIELIDRPALLISSRKSVLYSRHRDWKISLDLQNLLTAPPRNLLHQQIVCGKLFDAPYTRRHDRFRDRNAIGI
jgi:hypothetical protein